MGQVLAASLLSTALTLLVLWRYELWRERQHEDFELSDQAEEAAYTFRVWLADAVLLEVEADHESRDAVRAALGSYDGDWCSPHQVAAHVANYLAADRIARDLGCRSLWRRDDDGGFCDARR